MKKIESIPKAYLKLGNYQDDAGGTSVHLAYPKGRIVQRIMGLDKQGYN